MSEEINLFSLLEQIHYLFQIQKFMSNMQDFYCEEISGFFNFPHSLSDNESRTCQ